MPSAVLIPVSEYLRTIYRPDCDYIDGEVRERTVGEKSRAKLQLLLGMLFELHRHDWNTDAMTEQRVQVAPARYRIPDITVSRLSDPWEEVLHTPPLLCVEILSQGDAFSELQERVNDYAAMGVEHIWAVDPWQRAGYYASPNGFLKAANGVLAIPGTPISVNLPELFAHLPAQPARES